MKKKENLGGKFGRFYNVIFLSWVLMLRRMGEKEL